jgi:hypothetical protein
VSDSSIAYMSTDDEWLVGGLVGYVVQKIVPTGPSVSKYVSQVHLLLSSYFPGILDMLYCVCHIFYTTRPSQARCLGSSEGCAGVDDYRQKEQRLTSQEPSWTLLFFFILALSNRYSRRTPFIRLS